MITEGLEDKLCVLEGVILEVREEINGKFNIDKEEEKKLAGTLIKEVLPTEGCSRNGKR